MLKNMTATRCSHRAGDGAPMRLELHANQQSEQDKKRQRGQQRGKPPASEWVVDLSPVHGALFSAIGN